MQPATFVAQSSSFYRNGTLGPNQLASHATPSNVEPPIDDARWL